MDEKEIIQADEETESSANGENSGDIAYPEIMSDEDFESYLEAVKNNTVPQRQEESNNAASGENSGETAGLTDTQDSGKDVNANNAAANGEENGEVADPDTADSTTAAQPYKTFESQEDWQRTIDGIVQKRLRQNREDIKTLDDIRRQANAFYGGEDENAALKQLIDDLRNQNAERQGMDADEYSRREQDMIDAQKYRESQKEIEESQDKIAQIQERWNRESEDLKTLIPDFDFMKAMKNPVFYNAIESGKSVSTAYLAANRAEAAEPQAQPPISKSARKPIPQNGAMAATSTGTVDFNAETASDADFLKYINKIKNKR